ALPVARLPAPSLHGNTAGSQHAVGHLQHHAAGRDVDVDDVAILHQTDSAAGGSLRRDVTDGETRGTAGEAAIGDQGALFAQPHGLEIGGGIEHLLHAGAALGPFVADHYHFTGLDCAIQNAGNRRVLALEYPCRATEAEVLVIHAGRFYDGA